MDKAGQDKARNYHSMEASGGGSTIPQRQSKAILLNPGWSSTTGFSKENDNESHTRPLALTTGPEESDANSREQNLNLKCNLIWHTEESQEPLISGGLRPQLSTLSDSRNLQLTYLKGGELDLVQGSEPGTYVPNRGQHMADPTIRDGALSSSSLGGGPWTHSHIVPGQPSSNSSVCTPPKLTQVKEHVDRQSTLRSHAAGVVVQQNPMKKKVTKAYIREKVRQSQELQAGSRSKAAQDTLQFLRNTFHSMGITKENEQSTDPGDLPSPWSDRRTITEDRQENLKLGNKTRRPSLESARLPLRVDLFQGAERGGVLSSTTPGLSPSHSIVHPSSGLEAVDTLLVGVSDALEDCVHLAQGSIEQASPREHDHPSSSEDFLSTGELRYAINPSCQHRLCTSTASSTPQSLSPSPLAKAELEMGIGKAANSNALDATQSGAHLARPINVPYDAASLLASHLTAIKANAQAKEQAEHEADNVLVEVPLIRCNESFPLLGASSLASKIASRRASTQVVEQQSENSECKRTPTSTGLTTARPRVSSNKRRPIPDAWLSSRKPGDYTSTIGGPNCGSWRNNTGPLQPRAVEKKKQSPHRKKSTQSICGDQRRRNDKRPLTIVQAPFFQTEKRAAERRSKSPDKDTPSQPSTPSRLAPRISHIKSTSSLRPATPTIADRGSSLSFSKQPTNFGDNPKRRGHTREEAEIVSSALDKAELSNQSLNSSSVRHGSQTWAAVASKWTGSPSPPKQQPGMLRVSDSAKAHSASSEVGNGNTKAGQAKASAVSSRSTSVEYSSYVNAANPSVVSKMSQSSSSTESKLKNFTDSPESKVALPKGERLAQSEEQSFLSPIRRRVDMSWKQTSDTPRSSIDALAESAVHKDPPAARSFALSEATAAQREGLSPQNSGRSWAEVVSEGNSNSTTPAGTLRSTNSTAQTQTELKTKMFLSDDQPSRASALTRSSQIEQAGEHVLMISPTKSQKPTAAPVSTDSFRESSLAPESITIPEVACDGWYEMGNKNDPENRALRMSKHSREVHEDFHHRSNTGSTLPESATTVSSLNPKAEVFAYDPYRTVDHQTKKTFGTVEELKSMDDQRLIAYGQSMSEQKRTSLVIQEQSSQDLRRSAKTPHGRQALDERFAISRLVAANRDLYFTPVSVAPSAMRASKPVTQEDLAFDSQFNDVDNHQPPNPLLKITLPRQPRMEVKRAVNYGPVHDVFDYELRRRHALSDTMNMTNSPLMLRTFQPGGFPAPGWDRWANAETTNPWVGMKSDIQMPQRPNSPLIMDGAQLDNAIDPSRCPQWPRRHWTKKEKALDFLFEYPVDKYNSETGIWTVATFGVPDQPSHKSRETESMRHGGAYTKSIVSKVASKRAKVITSEAASVAHGTRKTSDVGNPYHVDDLYEISGPETAKILSGAENSLNSSKLPGIQFREIA